MRISREKLDWLNQIVQEVSEREGCRLYDIEVHPSVKSRNLRIVIDKVGESSPTLQDCENVSKGLSLLLDVEDVVPGGAYQLEVSSPGIERKLKKDWHFKEAVGEQIKLKCAKPYAPIEGGGPSVKSFKAHLIDFDGVTLKLQSEQKLWEVPFTDVEGGQVIFDYGSLTGKKKKN